jgi:hypothetical protein
VRQNLVAGKIEQDVQLDQSKLKILLAEDSLVNQKVAINQLTNLGYSADVAGNGKEVLEMLAHVPYDIILMDCQMPILDGYEASRRVRELEVESKDRKAKIIIIALTANAMKEDRDRCLAAGMDDYLSKPIRKEDLGAKLSHWGQILAQTISLETTQNLIDESATSNKSNNNTETYKSISESEIDWQYLEEVSGGDSDFKHELLQAYISSLPEHLQSLQIAITNQQCLEIEREAHFIKGTSAALGINGIAKLADILEFQSRQGQVSKDAFLLYEKIMLGIRQIEELI